MQGLHGSKIFVYEHLVPKVLEANGVDPANWAGAFILETMLNWDDTPESQKLPLGFGEVNIGIIITILCPVLNMIFIHGTLVEIIL